MTKLLIATNNKGKVNEYRTLLKGVPFDLVTLAEAGVTGTIEENGQTFTENANLKASGYAALSGLLTLADDSGISVQAMNGAPGIRSSRYAGENATDGDRVNFLLAVMNGVPWERRLARFCCVIAIAEPGKETQLFDGECEGYVSLEPAGKLGFGYDPIFYFPELDKTMAELPPEVKNRISHRARAAVKAREALIRMSDTSAR